MLNQAEHGIFSAIIYENANKYLLFLYLLAEKCSCSAMFSKKELISHFRFIIRTDFMLSCVYEKTFYNLGARTAPAEMFY